MKPKLLYSFLYKETHFNKNSTIKINFQIDIAQAFNYIIVERTKWESGLTTIALEIHSCLKTLCPRLHFRVQQYNYTKSVLSIFVDNAESKTKYNSVFMKKRFWTLDIWSSENVKTYWTEWVSGGPNRTHRIPLYFTTLCLRQ